MEWLCVPCGIQRRGSLQRDFVMPSVSLSLPAALAGRARTWVCLSCMFWVSRGSVHFTAWGRWDWGERILLNNDELDQCWGRLHFACHILSVFHSFGCIFWTFTIACCSRLCFYKEVHEHFVIIVHLFETPIEKKHAKMVEEECPSCSFQCDVSGFTPLSSKSDRKCHYFKDDQWLSQSETWMRSLF